MRGNIQISGSSPGGRAARFLAITWGLFALVATPFMADVRAQGLEKQDPAIDPSKKKPFLPQGPDEEQGSVFDWERDFSNPLHTDGRSTGLFVATGIIAGYMSDSPVSGLDIQMAYRTPAGGVWLGMPWLAREYDTLGRNGDITLQSYGVLDVQGARGYDLADNWEDAFFILRKAIWDAPAPTMGMRFSARLEDFDGVSLLDGGNYLETYSSNAVAWAQNRRSPRVSLYGERGFAAWTADDILDQDAQRINGGLRPWAGTSSWLRDLGADGEIFFDSDPRELPGDARFADRSASRDWLRGGGVSLRAPLFYATWGKISAQTGLAYAASAHGGGAWGHAGLFWELDGIGAGARLVYAGAGSVPEPLFTPLRDRVRAVMASGVFDSRAAGVGGEGVFEALRWRGFFAQSRLLVMRDPYFPRMGLAFGYGNRDTDRFSLEFSYYRRQIDDWVKLFGRGGADGVTRFTASFFMTANLETEFSLGLEGQALSTREDDYRRRSAASLLTRFWW